MSDAAPASGGPLRSYLAPIAAMAVFGMVIGLSAPLLSLILESRGYGSAMIGLNATATAVAILLGSPLVPVVARRIGLRALLLTALFSNVVLFALLALVDDYWAWFVFRFFMGLTGSALFVGSEAWISQVAPDGQRGRIIGLYATALSAGFASGPLLVPIVGIQGLLPFATGCGLFIMASLPLLAGTAPPVHGRSAFGILTFIRQAPPIATATACFGLIEFGTFGLLPVYGVRLGLSEGRAATLLSAMALGQIVLQIPIGWLADRHGAYRMLKLCAAVGLLGPIAILLLPLGYLPLLVLLFVWGGTVAGLYGMSLALVGGRFDGPSLVTANAALATLYGSGAILGPSGGGVAMDLWNPHGLIAVLALVAAAALLTARGKTPWR